MRTSPAALAVTAILTAPWLVASCGSDGNANDGGAIAVDARPSTSWDSGPAIDSGPCVPGGTECTNCIDDDGDLKIDNNDPECTGSADNDESSFGTDIPGDNQDSKTQDCFFDGNSGGGLGDDGCAYHTCCILDLMGQPCPAELEPPKFDPADCTVTEQCIEFCSPLTPPGCDCFGCCTICNDADCFDVLTNPAVAPDCTFDVIDDPDKCPPCVKNADCGQQCNPLECILCPGQTTDDLGTGCTGNICPSGQPTCIVNSDCGSGEFCASGCCIAGVD